MTLYFMRFWCVIIVLFNVELNKSLFSAYSFLKKASFSSFCVLCLLSFLFLTWCQFCRLLYNICVIILVWKRCQVLSDFILTKEPHVLTLHRIFVKTWNWCLKKTCFQGGFEFLRNFIYQELCAKSIKNWK